MGITENIGMTSATLSVDIYQNIFQRIEPGVQIDSVDEEQGSGRGDNYTATLYRIQLKGHRKCVDEKNTKLWEKALISKRLPENLARREAYKSDKLFRNEVEFYTTIMPELLRFQSSKTDKVFTAIPNCYFARSDILIMEDLRSRDFKMPDRKQGLSIDETEIVLKQLAVFHGLSLAYKFEKPQQFETLRNLTSEGLFCASNEAWYKNYYQRLTQNAIAMVSDVLAEDSKYLITFKEFAESTSFFSRMMQLVGTESTLSAICHGDCWANNFLYRYETNGEHVNVLEVCLVDFQLIRYSSITLDVANLLFCCTSKSMRDEHLNRFLKLYTGELWQCLQKLCTHIPEACATQEKLYTLFLQELKIFARFALGLALDIIPISTCSTDDAPDMYITTLHSEELENGAPELNFPPNDLCRQKMSDVLIDLVDRGML